MTESWSHVTEEEQRELIDSVGAFNLEGALVAAKRIVEATGDLPQSDWHHLSLMQRDVASAMKQLAALRPSDAPPYDPKRYR
jgi:hypothetical protein